MRGRFKFKFWLVLLLIILVVFPGCWFLLQRLEGDIPSVVIMPSMASIGKIRTFQFDISDPKSGIRKIRVALLKNEKEIVLYKKAFPAGSFGGKGTVDRETFDVVIEPKKLGLSDGRALLQILVRDYSWRSWWRGNKNYIEKPVLVDTQPPEIDVLTRMHNISQGGSGLVIYSVSETCPETGVMVGDRFFPGHSGNFDDDDIHMAFFALDHTQGPGTGIFIKSTDRAGNIAQAGFPHYIKKKLFRTETLSVTDRFLDWKMPEFKVDDPEKNFLSNLEKYLVVNRDLRKANYEELARLVEGTENSFFWKGAFSRLPGSARKAGFADRRKYQYKGKTIDRQVHMGIDLASVRQAPVPAANTGKVVFADYLGIYGKCVFLDHGYGLFSMYSHLSRINVATGQMVTGGEILGQTGTTGLAGGDHLHFGMMVHHTFVNPIEWWDAGWIKNNVTSKIEDVKSDLN